MLKYYIKSREALLRLRTDNDGVVSFEYVIVAACIVGAVIAVFGTGTAGGIHDALDGVLQKIITKMGTITV
jgi:Flp pilus assembly pilin Flp